MDDLIIILQQAVPKLHHRFRGRLAGSDVSSGGQLFIKFLLGQIDILVKSFLIDHKWHGQHMYAKLLASRLGDTAVAVRDNCYIWHILFPHFCMF